MFLCNQCGKCSKVGEKATRVVLETRSVVYPERRNKDREVIDRGGNGHETVREAVLCPRCLAG